MVGLYALVIPLGHPMKHVLAMVVMIDDDDDDDE